MVGAGLRGSYSEAFTGAQCRAEAEQRSSAKTRCAPSGSQQVNRRVTRNLIDTHGMSVAVTSAASKGEGRATRLIASLGATMAQAA
jgi:hypothetical protein